MMFRVTFGLDRTARARSCRVLYAQRDARVLESDIAAQADAGNLFRLIDDFVSRNPGWNAADSMKSPLRARTGPNS